MRVRFEGLSATIEMPDDPEFLAVLRAAAPGWPFFPVDSDDEPVARVRCEGGRFEILSPWDDDPGFIAATAVSAACSVIVDLITSYIDANPSRLCLHCGSALLGGRLVVFPSRSRAGKSTLIARLAAAGHQVYGDDVLPLDDTDSHGIALGLAPRPRVPLPERSTLSFRQFVARHAGPADDRYIYLDLGEQLASRGASAPLGAIVLLDRRAEGPAVLGPAPRAETLKSLITQNFARAEPAGALLDRLHNVMSRLPSLALTYSDLDQAADLLERTFSAWPPRLPDGATRNAARTMDDRSEAGPWQPDAGDAATVKHPDTPAAASCQQRWRRNPSITLHVVDGEAFLAAADGSAIHHLNAVGTAVWNLLADSIRQDDAVAVLQTAFPEIEPDIICRDVAALFTALAGQGLIDANEEQGAIDRLWCE